MTNNDILRRLRFTLDLNDAKIISLFKILNEDVSRAQISDWLKKDEDPAFRELNDKRLCIFLDALIIDKRGKREGPLPVPEEFLTNNMIFKKLKIAFSLTSDDIIEMFELIDRKIGPHELSAFFRNPKQRQYANCNDQYLRNFIFGLQKKVKGV